MDLLSGQRGRPGQALVGFSEGGGGAQAGEDLSRRAEGLSGLGRAAESEQAAAESQQAAAESQQRMRAFPWHLEFLPAAFSVGV